MIDAQPGIQSLAVPHGITLLQHAKNGFNSDGATDTQKKGSEKVIRYLEGLGNADVTQKSLEMDETGTDHFTDA